MKQFLALFTFILGISSVSQAGILVEPYLGYETGDLSYTPAVIGGDYKDTMTGTGFGLRLGYKFVMPWVALDYSSVSGKDKTGGSAIGLVDSDYTRSALGVVVGVDLPILFRVWAGYGLSNEVTFKSSGNLDSKLKGGFMKIGAGMTLLPFTSLNLEYKVNTYTKYDNGVSETDIKNTFSSHKNDMMMLSISVPFNL